MNVVTTLLAFIVAFVVAQFMSTRAILLVLLALAAVVSAGIL